MTRTWMLMPAGFARLRRRPAGGETPGRAAEILALHAALKKTGDRPTLLLIQRQGRDIFVTVKPANG